MNIKILVAYHKPSINIKDDVFFPIHVGKKNNPNLNLEIQGDDTGDNISDMNPLYCEMTAIYWGWKNLKVDYVGLCHYRRFFSFYGNSLTLKILNKIKFCVFKVMGGLFYPGKCYTYHDCLTINDKNVLVNYLSNFSDKIQKILSSKQYDAIVPAPYIYSNSNVRNQFIELGRYHFDLLGEIVKELRPDIYRYYENSLKSQQLFAANMAIFKNDIFEEYCNFIFPILHEHEKRIKDRLWCFEPLKEKCYSRMSGYLAEILTNCFVHKLKDQGYKILITKSIFFDPK